MKLYVVGKWFAMWIWGLGYNGRAGIEVNKNSWKLGVEVYPRGQWRVSDPLGKRLSIEVQVGPLIAYAAW
jgi:hypothetical protein